MPVRSYSQVLSVVPVHLSSCVHLQFLLLKPRSANQCPARMEAWICQVNMVELCSQSLDSRDLCDSDHDPLPDSASAVSASDQDLLPDSASIDSTVSSEASSHRCDSPESPKPLVRQKRRLRMIDEDKDGVRIKVVPSFKQKFRRQMPQTNRLQDDFFLPNRAQLVLNFLKKHGDQLVKEKPGPMKRFASTLRGTACSQAGVKKALSHIYQHYLCLPRVASESASPIRKRKRSRPP